MNLGEIRAEVVSLIQDDSYANDTLDDWINRAVQYAANLADLPVLKRTGTVDTSTTYPYVTLTGLTGGFLGKLKRINNASGDALVIYPTMEMLYDDYLSSDNTDMTKAGEVESVAVEGSLLWYQEVPAAAETLFLLYYRTPDTLSGNTDSPSDFPVHLHRSLFVQGAAYIAFDEIEDGIDEEKVNTKNAFHLSINENNKHSGITKLREWVGKNRVHHINSVWSA